jgi:two-component system, OmpR family, phosphate regulon sensor histidine kinase PhoR
MVQKPRKLLWRLYPSYVIVLLLSLGVMAWYALHALKALAYTESVERLKAEASLLEAMIGDKLGLEDAPWIESLCKRVGTKITSRITVILPSGKVVGDTAEDPGRLDDFSGRREVRTALKGQTGIAERYSANRDTSMIHVAVPVVREGQVVAVIRGSMPLIASALTVTAIFREAALPILLVAIVGVLLSTWVSHRINRALSELKEGAIRFAGGDLEYRLRIPRTEEMSELAEAMNAMAADLRQRIQMVTRQRNELEAVLSSMVEAVLVIDADERLISVNKAAERLFPIKLSQFRGARVLEVVRNSDLHEFVGRTLQEKEPVEADIVILGEPEKHLQAHGTKLEYPDGKVMGALVVLNDVTRLKSLERVRRDFVANVSHELKTPITTIKGFLETLKEGALKDPESAERFLDIVIRHTDRLAMIIEDLLILSRIEQETEKGGISLGESSVRKVLDAVANGYEWQARDKGVGISVLCDENLAGRINSRLLEQALSNMVDNAIKFSPTGTTVTLAAEEVDQELRISVQDQGCGIPKEHLTRVFERFYRVDKGRSRDRGGTGLGLAIAKHVINAHRGHIELRSSPGTGSTFTVHLPVNNTEREPPIQSS